MKEERIIAFIGLYGSMVLASTFKNEITIGIMVAQAIFWFIYYIYLKINE